MAWVSPTGHNDPENEWTDETKAYDESLGTYAYTGIGAGLPYTLELLHAAINCDKVQIQVYQVSAKSVDVDVYYSGAWHNIYSGTIPDATWEEIPIGSTQSVTKARTHKTTGWAGDYWVIEFDFNEVEGGEEKLLTATCSIASSTTGSLTLGKIESLTATCATATNIPSTILRLLYSITAHAPPATSTAGSLSVVKSLSGTSSVGSSTQAVLSVFKILTATSGIASSATGSLTLGKIESLSGTASTTSTVEGTLTVIGEVLLSATAAATSSLTGALLVIWSLAGTSVSQSVAIGSLSITRGAVKQERPTGVWIKQSVPSDGAVKQDRPTGTWIKQDKPS